MGSSLFPRPTGGIWDKIKTFNAITRGDSAAAYQALYQEDEQFRRFADSMRGKTPEQAFSENGLDYDQVRRFLS